MPMCDWSSDVCFLPISDASLVWVNSDGVGEDPQPTGGPPVGSPTQCLYINEVATSPGRGWGRNFNRMLQHPGVHSHRQNYSNICLLLPPGKTGFQLHTALQSTQDFYHAREAHEVLLPWLFTPGHSQTESGKPRSLPPGKLHFLFIGQN